MPDSSLRSLISSPLLLSAVADVAGEHRRHPSTAGVTQQDAHSSETRSRRAAKIPGKNGALSKAPSLSLGWVRSEDELREAQRLRYKVFGEEMGAALKGPAGLDVDEFDSRCDHLLVRDSDTLKVVGTYRLLPPSAAPKLSSLYSAREFDLRRLAVMRAKMVEVGRACVDPGYRSGAAILTLWSGLADYMRRWGFETMLGCSSVSMADGGHLAANLHRQLALNATVAPEYRVFPHTPLPVELLQDGGAATPPPLLKAYLRLGAKVCGAPAWDADFNTADFLTLLRFDDLDSRYAKRFGA